MSESQVAARFLYDLLNSDVALTGFAPGGVHDGVAPEGTAHPFVQIDMQVPADIYVVGATRIGSRDLWLIKVVGEGPSYAPLVSAAKRIDALLHAASGTVVHAASGGHVWACVREREHRMSEVDRGVHYRHLGGEYRIWTTQQEE